jgi:serine/threonine-protein kinase
MPRFGQFEVTAELGRGGMGVVYKGFDPAIRREVALKTIRLHDLDDPTERTRMQERLEREAQSAGRLSHPNIVTIYQFGYEQIRPGETTAYIAMEYVPGRTLASLLAEGRMLQASVVISLLRQAAEGLDYAHAQGVIHRDVKPANLLITPDARLKIADFGVAKISAHTLTMTGTVLGSPFYMAPEQIRGEQVSPHSDQYSLAVAAFEAFGGRKPFDAETLSALVYKIVHEEPPALSLPDSEMARRINPVLLKALAKNPADRFPACHAFVDELAKAIEETGRRPAAEPPQSIASQPVTPVAQPVSAATPAAQPVRTSLPVPAIPMPVPQPASMTPAAPAAPVPKPLVTKAGMKWLLLAGGAATAGLVGWVMLSEPDEAGMQPSSTAIQVKTEQAPLASPQKDNRMAVPPPPVQPVQTAASIPQVRQSPPPTKSLPLAQPVRTEEPEPPTPSVKPASTPVQQAPAVVEKEMAPPVQSAPVEPQAAPKEVIRTAPRLLRQVQPNYTPEARHAGIEGVVGLTVQLNEEGIPVRAGVAKSLDPGLDRKAIEAVAQWRFAPATADGKPVAATVNVEVRFQTVGSPGRGRPTLKK